MQIYYEFFISATISSPNMTRDSNELKLLSSVMCCGNKFYSYFPFNLIFVVKASGSYN